MFEFVFYFYNFWKSGVQYNVVVLFDYFEKDDFGLVFLDVSVDVLQIVSDFDVCQEFVDECCNLLFFDFFYDCLIQDFKFVVCEVMEMNKILKEFVGCLFEVLFGVVVEVVQKNLIWNCYGVQSLEEEFCDVLYKWICWLGCYCCCVELFKVVVDWKKVVYLQVFELFFGLIIFFFDCLLQNYYYVEIFGGCYDGLICLCNIGIKDFWN